MLIAVVSLSLFFLVGLDRISAHTRTDGIFDVARMGPFRRINTLRGSSASLR